MKKLFGFFILVFLLECGQRNVAAVEQTGLGVDIRTYDNETVMVMTGHTCYSSVPLVFTPRGTEGISYSISTDGGMSWGAFVPMDKENITIFPDDNTSQTGRWLIKFKQESEEGEIYSDVCDVCFDTASPAIELTDPEKISGWLCEDETVTLAVSDNTGISRIIAKCADKTIGELQEKEGEIATECMLLIPLGYTGKKINTVEAVCYDLAGNSSVLTFEYMYDNKSPTISVNGIREGEIYASSMNVILEADDGDDDAFISYVLERKTKDEIITKAANDLVGKANIDISEDGRYTLTVSSYDSAKNRSEELTRRFCIDTTSPQLVVRGVPESADIRQNVRIALDVEDESYEDTVVDIMLKRTALGKTDIIPIEPYKAQGIPDSREVYINSDGEYELTLSATDGAGNSRSVSKTFRIDTNAPEISISGISEGVATSSKPVVRFCAGEMFYDSTIMTSILEKKEKGGSRLISKEEHVMKAANDHVDVVVGSEGAYTLTCIAADRSGNQAKKSISFTVDYTPPVITGMSDIDSSYFKTFSLPKKIKELVSDSTNVVADAYVNDVPFRDGDSIVREGKYVLTILAKDEADNESEDSAVFIVDHTAPQIVLEGFDKNGNIPKGSRVRVGLFDAADRLMSVRFDGDDIPISNGLADFPVVDYGSHCLSVKAEDDAGNVTDTDIHTECYMSSIFPGPVIKTENLVTRSDESGDEEGDVDPLGLMVGMLSVLSGSFGFVYRTFLRD